MTHLACQKRGRIVPFSLVLVLVLVLGSADTSMAKRSSSAQKLAAALKLHEDATDFAGEVAALDALRQAADSQPDDWHAAFWTSYVATQVGRLIILGRAEGDPNPYLDTSRTYLDRARTLFDTAAGRDASSLHALEALLLQWRGQAAGEGDDGEHATRAREALNAAVRADSTNPVVLVMAGTAMIAEGREGADLSQVLGGLRLVQEAQRLFATDTRPRSQTTAFNTEWLPFWIPFAEKTLQESANP